jgi:hypothetical protein
MKKSPKFLTLLCMAFISYHQNDTQSLCKSLFLLCFLFLFLFSILANFYINFETGKLPAHERNNFIFHVNMHFCNIVLFHKCRYWVLWTQRIILFKNFVVKWAKMLAIFFRQFVYDTAYDDGWMLYHSVVTPCIM